VIDLIDKLFRQEQVRAHIHAHNLTHDMTHVNVRDGPAARHQRA
jgi:hypothetical protein